MRAPGLPHAGPRPTQWHAAASHDDSHGTEPRPATVQWRLHIPQPAADMWLRASAPLKISTFLSWLSYIRTYTYTYVRPASLPASTITAGLNDHYVFVLALKGTTSASTPVLLPTSFLPARRAFFCALTMIGEGGGCGSAGTSSTSA